ncbi:hypothetical protein MA9V2_230 [Chryseobacterium phage MA9V-2]|nr:hypothetical protein MA9V2_230 [Chryseobacterium phage MA9V-2]
MTTNVQNLGTIFADKFNEVMANEANVTKAYQVIAKFCISQANQADEDDSETIAFWNEKETYCMDKAKSGVAKVATTIERFQKNTSNFKTEFKFSSKEERTIYQRFVENKENTTNKLMYYTVTDENFNYRTESGIYFHNMVNAIVERFNEISNYEFAIVDKEFLVNNEFAIDTELGRRYAFYVDTDDFHASTKEQVASVYSKVHPGCRVFVSYEALAEHISTYIRYKAIYILSDQAFNALRYLVDSIEVVKCPNLDLSEFGDDNLVSHDFQAYAEFLSFRKFNTVHYTNSEVVEVEVEQKQEFFSDFIRFKSTGKAEKKSVTKDITYDLVTISKPASKVPVYRFAKRMKQNPGTRQILIQNILLTLNENLQLENIEVMPEDFTLSNNKDYVMHSQLNSIITIANRDADKFHAGTLEALTNILQIQIRK